MNGLCAERIVTFDRTVVSLVDRFRTLQGRDGAVRADATAQADRLLRDIEAALTDLAGDLVLVATRDAFAQDVVDWRGRGLDTPPLFDAVRKVMRAPPDGGIVVFCGAVSLPNSGERVSRLEAFAAVREEPDSCRALFGRYPHPHNVGQSTHLVSGTAGVREGNCVVLFPENIPARNRCDAQQFALFFFNKHVRIYRETLRLVREYCGGRSPFEGRDRLVSPSLDRWDTYAARCIWGYLHDYYHHTGPRPFHEHLPMKLGWVLGTLEEIKVDSQSASACIRDPEIAFRHEIFEYILLERIFRYPHEPDAEKNSDSATGCLLFEWLARCDALRWGSDRVQLAAPEALVEALDALVREIEAIERLDDDDYQRRAQDLVFSLLDPPAGASARFGFPNSYRRLQHAHH